ncbi:hypothetical protein P886_2031 [Alteromonadaceae bacterium 2753L.S.0a.02]|nr:hypothetical protein P886_2031 [Alteromonadaceae bacterium 2753L.S.0a.02]
MPKTAVQIDGLMVASVAVIGGIGVLWWNREKIAAGLKQAADKVNPTSDKNLAYEAVNGIGDIFDDGIDNDGFSLGSWVYDVTHPNEEYD